MKISAELRKLIRDCVNLIHYTVDKIDEEDNVYAAEEFNKLSNPPLLKLKRRYDFASGNTVKVKRK